MSIIEWGTHLEDQKLQTLSFELKEGVPVLFRFSHPLLKEEVK